MKGPRTVAFLLFSFSTLAFVYSCGHENGVLSSDTGVDANGLGQSLVNPSGDNPLDPPAVSKSEGFKRIIQSDAYNGELVVFLKSPSDVTDLERVLKSYPNTKLKRSTTLTLEEETKRRQELEKKTGKKFLDWNRVYYVLVSDKQDAEKLLNELLESRFVSLIYPKQKQYAPHAGGTPNLEGLQTYLEGPDRAGLNIRQAWNQGVYGDGVMIAVGDNGINWEHEEFELSSRWVGSGGNSWGMECVPESADVPGYICTSSNVAHGTATTGMIHARHGVDGDWHGVSGIAPEAWTTIGIDRTPKGSVHAFECANQFSWDGSVTCQPGANGLACVPCESEPGVWAGIREAVYEDDIIIFETAGNGAINLDTTQLIDDATMEIICGGPRTDPRAADCWRSSGAILVGAHQGDRDMAGGQPRKEGYSNCGNKAELSGWGERVVTTSWRNNRGESPWGWVNTPAGPNPPNDDPNRFYTNQFGGTSAAAAMVAGAATLVQSYFKDIADNTPVGDGSVSRTRYLTPAKMRDILVATGTPTHTDDGCGIGKQPNVAEALNAVRSFWDQVKRDFPELLRDQQLTEARYRQLHNLGMGLDRWDNSFPPGPPVSCNRDNPEANPIQCFRDNILPLLSKKMDLDEDYPSEVHEWRHEGARGDLISWEPIGAQGAGRFKIDLSSGDPIDPECGEEGHAPCPPPNDNYGAWDLTIEYPSINSKWQVPVVEDYNSDGKADLAIYDREHGWWYISFTDDATLRGEWNGWEELVRWPNVGDRQTWNNEWYTRPLPADYNNDKWIDLAVQTSDGHWKINFGWRQVGSVWNGRRFEEYGPLIPDYTPNEVGRWTSPGVWDLAYLTAEELRAYPGWSYLPSVFGSHSELAWRGPNGELHSISATGLDRLNWSEYGFEPSGGIEDTILSGNFGEADLGIKTRDGIWKYYSMAVERLIQAPPPNGIFGGTECKAMIADLDGDIFIDRIVQCPSEWKIAYSSDTFASQNNGGGFRHIPLSYDNPTALPGQPVFGGLSYERVQQVRNYIHNLGQNQIPPLFDYAMTPYEYCDLPWHIFEMPTECR